MVSSLRRFLSLSPFSCLTRRAAKEISSDRCLTASGGMGCLLLVLTPVCLSHGAGGGHGVLSLSLCP
jgi:hypothetical protein